MTPRIGDPGYRCNPKYGGHHGGRSGSRRAPAWFWIGSAAWVAAVLAFTLRAVGWI